MRKSNDPVSCPVCASAAPLLCGYDNHANTTSIGALIKDAAARIGWGLLTVSPKSAVASMGRIARKFSAGVFKFHQIYRCDSCELGFVHPAIKPSHLNRYYSQAYWSDFRFEAQMDTHIEVGQPRSAAQFDLLSSHVDFPSLTQALEIGPGPGCISQTIKEIHPHISFSAVEPSMDWAENHAKSSVFSSFYRDIADIGEREQFDLILSSHSLEHVPDLTAFMETLCQLVKPGAIVFFEVPNCSDTYFKTSHRDLPHTYFFTPSAMERLAAKTGFAVLELGAWGHPWTEPDEAPADGGVDRNENGDVVRAVLRRLFSDA